MTIPGNLIVKNGGRVLATGTIDWGHTVVAEDMILDGGTLRVVGDLHIEGTIKHDESCAIAACYPLEENEFNK